MKITNSKKSLKKVVKFGKLLKNYNIIKPKKFRINSLLLKKKRKKKVLTKVKSYKNTFSLKSKKNIKNLDNLKNKTKIFYKFKKRLNHPHFIHG